MKKSSKKLKKMNELFIEDRKKKGELFLNKHWRKEK